MQSACIYRVIHPKVDLLIAGLEELGCQRTTGEDQTLCIMSDSFNLLGGQSGLQESGDLPPDEFLTIVEVRVGAHSFSGASGRRRVTRNHKLNYRLGTYLFHALHVRPVFLSHLSARLIPSTFQEFPFSLVRAGIVPTDEGKDPKHRVSG